MDERTARAGREALVELICRAVCTGDGHRVDALLTVLEAVADTPLLDRLATALGGPALVPAARAPVR
ncbi:hypothetical protein KNE206_59840 [Kitasatospora sp. NE20-6]|uniref:hypothetical protein n=1 Tax=Kitasatospora sp. NE20-6 TaxID=2859066 RepID=UPI0034DBB767